jgi:UDP-N-acetylmuramoylalanine--D-glutamate ligase
LNLKITRPEDLHGLKATVIGLGVNGGGLASARFLAENGVAVTVTDMKDEVALAESIEILKPYPIRYVLGRHEIDDFSSADLVVKNPAVRSDSPFLLAARAIETDISLFLRFSSSPIIAITGSKGKSTVASAIHHVLGASGLNTFLGGNIAISPLSFLEKTDSNTPVVLELSSWQLADMRGLEVLKPMIAVLTSIMPDHMNRYSTMEEYVADKRLIYAAQDSASYTICNWDDPWGRTFASETNGTVLWYSSAPTGEPGAWIELSDYRRGFYSASGDVRHSEEILPRNLLIHGNHQRMNLLAAALACRTYGIPAKEITSEIASFRGVEHRLELFAEKNGVTWYNDSAATIPQAVAAALDSFTNPVILVTGGTDKNLDFEEFQSSYSKAKRIVLLSGTGTDKLIPILRKGNIPFSGPYEKLSLAIASASDFSASGDSIVLSPGCTSFGMFINEFDRGRKFKHEVLEFLSIEPFH